MSHRSAIFVVGGKSHPLAPGHFTITEIALDCRFSSSAYFASVFRCQAQCSPRDYRAVISNH